MKHFREALEACVSELRRHPRVRVTHFWVGPPATEAELVAVESVVGPLPPPVRDFYSVTNGVQLRWIDAESPSYTDADDKPPPATYVWSPAGEAQTGDGLVDIGPVESLLEAHDLYDNGDEVRAFDTIDDYGMVAFAQGAAVTSRLRIGEDHNVSWEELPFDFSTYLELIVGTYGHRARRKEACFGKRPPDAVPLASLLSPAPLPPTAVAERPTRVEFEDDRYSGALLRGTASRVHARGSDPSSLLSVRTDLGEDVYLARRRAAPLAEKDTYELARQDPSGFLAALARVSPLAARGMLGSLLGKPSFSRVRDSHFPVGVAPEVWRVVSVFAPLGPGVVVPALARLLTGWLGDVGQRAEAASITANMSLAETITAVLGRAIPAWSPTGAARELSDLATAAEAYGASFPRTPSPPLLSDHAAYWRAVVAGTAPPLKAPVNHRLGTKVGLEGIPLLD